MIKKGSQVKLHYTLSVDDEVVDSSQNDEPLSYTHGEEQIVPGLEEHLEGMGVGEKKKATVDPEKGYGLYSEEGLQAVARSAFNDPSGLKPGDVVSGQAEGQAFEARVTEVGDEEITLDLNHPLAGKTLEFEVEIVEVV
jgi:FKBP-type peptidyl-prolyl cis-trans isomerase SlyD